jgi:hypothetical protein
MADMQALIDSPLVHGRRRQNNEKRQTRKDN